MTTAKLEISLPDSVWAAEVTRRHEEVTVSPLAHVSRSETGFGLALISGGDLDVVKAEIESHESIIELEVIGRTNHEMTIEFSTDQPLLLFSSKASGTAIQMPVRIENGIANVEVTGSRDRLSSLCEHLEALDLEFDVAYVQEYSDPGGMLSDRQRELLCAAVDRGYYDSPRECTLTELAEDFGIAKSTCSEILHRAEGQIVRAFRENLPVAREESALNR